MKTEQLWVELKTRAQLLQPTPGQLSAMAALEEIAVRTTPNVQAGNATIERDQDGDIIILLQETHEGEIVVNGEWAKVVIEDDGWVCMTASNLEGQLTHWFPV